MNVHTLYFFKSGAVVLLLLSYISTEAIWYVSYSTTLAMVIIPASFQSYTIKNQMFICLEHPVGLFALMISIVDWMSLYIGVGSVFSTPSSSITDLTYLMFFAAVTAAMSSALVELSAVIDCALD